MEKSRKFSTKAPAIHFSSLNTTTKCTICLDNCTDQSFVDPCLHKYCYPCITAWSKKNQVCPLCMRKFNKVYHNVRQSNDYDVTFITPDNSDRSDSESGDSGDTDSDDAVVGNMSNLSRVSGVLLGLFSSASGLLRFGPSSDSTPSDSDVTIFETSFPDTSEYESSGLDISDISSDLLDISSDFAQQNDSTDESGTENEDTNPRNRSQISVASPSTSRGTASEGRTRSTQTRYNLRRRVSSRPRSAPTALKRRRRNI